jgi:large conductance mechanosensitive channel
MALASPIATLAIAVLGFRRATISGRGGKLEILIGGGTMWQEFKDFAFKGNAFDLAIGVIMGGAFGKIVESIVKHLIMPIVSVITGGVSFDNMFVGLNSAVSATNLVDAEKQGSVFAYGAFITVLINFLILAWIMFMLVKASNRMKKATPPPPPAPPAASEVLLGEIRDLLKKR